MDSAVVSKNALLRVKLDQLSLADPDYWSFRGNARRDHGHGLLQYPAMMVPQMVRRLLSAICETEQVVGRVGDPFVGSGTVLTETTLTGLDFWGRDINPLAMLSCRVKAGPVFPEALSERGDELLARIREDRKRNIEADFDGIDKWFEPEIKVALSRLRRGIRAEKSLWARRFFWLAMAETVRASSNSRTSTFKLHIRSEADRQERCVDVLRTFERLLLRNVVRIKSLATALRQAGSLKRGRYTGDVELVLGDSRLPPKLLADLQCDVVITSPPYGDNVTTVPYGQYSYLPLQWIDLRDIENDLSDECLNTTHEIDRRSLGGSRRVAPDVTINLRDRSPNLARTLDALAGAPADRSQRVSAFVRDLDTCVPHVCNMLRPGGIMVWVLGNRRVGGQTVPLDRILDDLLRERDATMVTELRRRIPSKRMAIRNSVATTMANETILIFRKGADNGQAG